MVYSYEQIMKSKDYSQLCKCFFELAQDEDTLNKLECILFEGCIGEYSMCSKFERIDGPGLERLRRISMAYLLISQPDTFNFFVENNINIFHGTNANALPGILKYGINSFDKLEEQNISVLTGEEWSRRFVGRDFISFTDVFEIASAYSSKCCSLDNYLAFGVIIGTTEEEMNNNNLEIIRVSSDISEIGVMNYFPLKGIKCICVPEDKISFVKRMVNDDKIKVLGLPDIHSKFYFWNYGFGDVIFKKNLYEDYLKEYMQNKNLKTEEKFREEDVKDIATSRKFSGMKKMIDLILKILRESEDFVNGRGSRL